MRATPSMQVGRLTGSHDDAVRPNSRSKCHFHYPSTVYSYIAVALQTKQPGYHCTEPMHTDSHKLYNWMRCCMYLSDIA